MSLAELFVGALNAQAEARKVLPVKDQLAALTTVSDRINEDAIMFTEGELVAHKFPDLSESLYARRPGVFLGYLGAHEVVNGAEMANVSDIGSNRAADVLDCRIGFVCDEGHFHQYLEDSRHYRRWTDADTAAMEAKQAENEAEAKAKRDEALAAAGPVN